MWFKFSINIFWIKKDDTCSPLDSNLTAWIELPLWRCKRCHKHANLTYTSSMHVHYWTSVSLKRLYIGQFPSLHFEDRDGGFVSKGSKDVSHDNKIFSCTMELRNESASFLMILVLFCFHLGRFCDLCYSQKCWKSFYSCNKNTLFSYDIIQGIQKATSISFFLY